VLALGPETQTAQVIPNIGQLLEERHVEAGLSQMGPDLVSKLSEMLLGKESKRNRRPVVKRSQEAAHAVLKS
jgi:hypothetical protein